ncbi:MULTISPECIES: type I restriction endonuclease [Moorena]|uniref:Type I restriction enzyme R protein n=1 Tax=Moorena producens 3L TaxID=489825 RepID=F4Y0E1_9CYAN|nr:MULTISPECIES: type I restriction endonuclease [Moorena]EGJ29731.1 type I restriction enzyme R protein [Moorena producens 3L]NEP36384.1 restriction endonuclease subunit R [Moorena sp. SIO3B2]NEP68140.1 restriction endonuclease subunit R [Moorena sp. SIO3A5]NEQ10579.1 restriction endonuclease subunit R [Moorena sp. SIO4E2]NER90527.1 restriction endonuclease subunit R [Moorena sp. SIO3A2]
MVETIVAQDISLPQLKDKFGLEPTNDEKLFPEWQEDLPELNELEKQWLDRVKDDYLHLSEYPMVEPIVKMVVLSPLLRIADFYRPPFYILAEKDVQISSEDQQTIVRGRIDILICQPQFWIVVIEAKRAEYSLKVGIPQALAYMLANPELEKPAFGFVTNGGEFIFLKLIRQDKLQYAFSNQFSLLNRGNDLYTVARILKHLGQLVGE